MKKSNKIIYWVATLWLSLGMVSTGIVQLIPLEAETIKMQGLGYPIYLLTFIGVWKLLGVLAVLIPRYPLLKEWAYAGFFFLMSGALYSHAAANDPAETYFGGALLLILTVVSWYTRPADRKLI